jgi:basic membrane protein A
MGYVGAFTYAEVISGYTSFYLGAKYMCPSVTMEVTFTGSLYDETAEKEGATKLINDNCVLISQHADSMGAPNACQAAGVPNVSYNGSTLDSCPNTYLISSRIDWVPYMTYMIQQVKEGKPFDTDWCGTLATGSVQLTELNEKAAAPGTAEKLEEVRQQLIDGSLHVFDTSTFTVTYFDEATFTNTSATPDAPGHVTGYMADCEFDADYTPDTEVCKDGYLHESEFRSAPYFFLQLDGITIIG